MYIGQPCATDHSDHYQMAETLCCVFIEHGSWFGFVRKFCMRFFFFHFSYYRSFIFVIWESQEQLMSHCRAFFWECYTKKIFLWFIDGDKNSDTVMFHFYLWANKALRCLPSILLGQLSFTLIGVHGVILRIQMPVTSEHWFLCLAFPVWDTATSYRE